MSRPSQDAIDAICREIHRVDAMRHATQDKHGEAALWVRLEFSGEIIGLRKALCALFGWPMEEESDKEGAADQYVEQWASERPASSEETSG